MTLINYGKAEDLIVISLSFDSIHLVIQPTDPLPIRIRPGIAVKFNVQFTPEILGNITTYALIKLINGKSYIYKVKCFATQNSFDLNPIFISESALSESRSFPIEIRNPFPKQTLVLYCVQTYDQQIEISYQSYKGYQPTCCPCNPFIEIQPLTKVRAFNVIVPYSVQGYLYSSIRIFGNPDFSITIPILVRQSNGVLNISPFNLDFGIISAGSKPHRLKIKVDTSVSPISVSAIYTKPNPQFVLNFPEFTKYPVMIPKSQRPTYIGYIGFFEDTPGTYEGHIYIQTNISGVTKVKYKAEVIQQPIIYSINDIGIDITGEEEGKSYYHQIYLTSNIKGTVMFDNAELSLKNAQAGIDCPKGIGKCIKALNFGQKDSIVQVKYWEMKKNELPKKVDLTLLALQSLYTIPILFFDSSLTCSYNEYSNSGLIMVQKKCSEVNSINLGAFGHQTKSFSLNITNFGPVNTTLTYLALQNKSAFACFELTGIYDIISGSLKKEYSLGKVIGFRAGDKFQIDSNSIAAIKIYLSLDDCNILSLQSITEGDSFSNILEMQAFPAKETKIKLLYKYHNGEISFSPSRIRFEPGFPGSYQNKELRAISTFRMPLQILRTWSNDSRLKLALFQKLLLQNQRLILGLLLLILQILQICNFCMSFKRNIYHGLKIQLH